MKEKGTVYFFTGLAGAGKTTIGALFYERLKALSPNAVLLDGDCLRSKSRNHDYTYEGRLRGAWGVFQNCKSLSDQGIDVVYCGICMFHKVRAWNRENIAHYKEIYIKVKRETLLRRDQKQLYSSGVKNVVGVDIPFEEPDTPDVVVPNDGEETPETIVDRLERRLLTTGADWERELIS